MSAIYSIYTSPNHAPVPDHLPTLIVTPHGRPSHILYTFLHTSLNAENYLLTPSDAGDLCVAKFFPPPGNGSSRGSSAPSSDPSKQPLVRCEASRNLRWSITNTGIQSPVYKLTLPNPDQPHQEQPLFQVSKPNPNAPYWSLFYFTYAGHLIPPKRVEFGRIQKNSPESGGGTRVTITGKTEEEKAVWATLGEGNEDMVEWIVVGAALVVLDDEIVQAAERAGVPLSAGPPGQPRMPQQSQVRHGPPRGPPTRQPTLPPQMQQQQHRQGPPPQQLMPGQGGPSPQQQQQQRAPQRDPRMMDPRTMGRPDPRGGPPPQQQQSWPQQGPPPPGVAYGEMPQPQQPQFHHRGPPPQQQQQQHPQQVRHQLRDEPRAGPPPNAPPPQQQQQQPHPAQSRRPDLPPLDTLTLEDRNGGRVSQDQPHSAAREYAAMAVTSPTGYQAEPIPSGYEPAKLTQVAPQPSAYQPDSRGGHHPPQGGRAPSAGPGLQSDPRMRHGPQHHQQRDPYAAPSSNGHGGRPPPQHQSSLPPQGPSRATAPPPRPPSPPRSPPPPSPKDPAFLTWVASRDEHKWPEERGPSGQGHPVPAPSSRGAYGPPPVGAYQPMPSPLGRAGSVRAPGMPQVMDSPGRRGMLQKQRAAR